MSISVRNTISVGSVLYDFDLQGAVPDITYFGNNMFSTSKVWGFDPADYQGNNQPPPADLDDLFLAITLSFEDLHSLLSHLLIYDSSLVSETYTESLDRALGDISGFDPPPLIARVVRTGAGRTSLGAPESPPPGPPAQIISPISERFAHEHSGGGVSLPTRSESSTLSGHWSRIALRGPGGVCRLVDVGAAARPRPLDGRDRRSGAERCGSAAR